MDSDVDPITCKHLNTCLQWSHWGPQWNGSMEANPGAMKAHIGVVGLTLEVLLVCRFTSLGMIRTRTNVMQIRNTPLNINRI